MVVKVYISRTSGDMEIKSRQQAVLQILDSKKIIHEVIDIAEEDNKEQKEFMQKNATSIGATAMEPNPVHSLPPQIFNDGEYCGDYDEFEMANENKDLDRFLKLVPEEVEIHTSTAEMKISSNQQEEINDT
ncbi:hypothetical protein Zmor_015549 [Zophobas morio]|uniref:SH3 domain-binding glutamic acid-rich-like protein n=1 Tax=Zophobas morio TaxID=2755281 RepID=A0AA38IJK9_9CUCU|nr:hypothetical protein Zmor_015549 [Zophobas morio]